MARKFLPQEEKKRRGTYRPDRDPDVQIARTLEAAKAAGAEIPPLNHVEPPKDLDERQRQIFVEVVEEMKALGIVVGPYRRAIAHLARQEARAEEMRKNLGRKFILRVTDKETGDKLLKNNPALGQLADLESHITRLYSSLGLLPDALGKVPKVKAPGTTGSGNEEDDFGEFGS